jgi:hypothetical protein
MLTRMSDSPDGDPRAPTSAAESGVLASLPRTRPQRTSARRAASRAARPQAAPPRQTGKRRPASGRETGAEPAPRQGFEAEPDSLGSVQPPGGAELVASAAELAGELAKTGVAAGARVLRDFLSRLPG